jgi:hypothetical protein
MTQERSRKYNVSYRVTVNGVIHSGGIGFTDYTEWSVPAYSAEDAMVQVTLAVGMIHNLPGTEIKITGVGPAELPESGRGCCDDAALSGRKPVCAHDPFKRNTLAVEYHGANGMCVRCVICDARMGVSRLGTVGPAA